MKTSRKIWMLAIIFAFISAVLFYQFVNEVKTANEPKDMTLVVVAKQDIAKDSLIGPESVALAKIPSQYVQESAFKNLSDVVGKTAVQAIAKGDQVIKMRVINDGVMKQQLSYSIPEGKRAVSVTVDQVIGVSGFIKQDDRVDLLATVDIQNNNAQPQTVNVIALQDLQVLAVGSTLGGEILDETKKAETNTVTLAVYPREAQLLTLASERTKIRLALRPPTDHTKGTYKPYNLNELIMPNSGM
ncbi:MAG: Flp pilus assembly protein CpaB [Deltaproteobacteria bacterium]